MADDPPTLNLRLLSPSAELQGGLTFTSLPTSTTVAQLRTRIHDAVPSKPAPHRMRLIYRGRVVANDADTLESVFGADNIRESRDQSLHLVLPPSIPDPSPPDPRPATVPPHSVQTNPFRPPPSQAPAAPNSQPHQPPPQPQQQQQPPQHQFHPPAPPNDFFIALPAHIQQHFAHVFAHAGQPQAHLPNPLIPQLPNPMLPHAPQLPNPLLPHAPQLPNPLPPHANPTPDVQTPPNALPNNSRVVRQEVVGPNGARWSFIVNDLAAPSVPPAGDTASPRPPSPDSLQHVNSVLPLINLKLRAARLELENIITLAGAHSQATSNTPGQGNWHLVQIRNHLSALYRHLDFAIVGFGQAFAQATPAQMSSSVELTELRRTYSELKAQADTLARRFAHPQSSPALNSTLSPLINNGASPHAMPAAPMPTVSPSATTQPTPGQLQNQPLAPTPPMDCPPELFLLSSPQGPVGIVFDQRGSYMTAPIVPTLSFQTFSNQFAHNRQLIASLGQRIGQAYGPPHHQPTATQPAPSPRPPPAAEALQEPHPHLQQNQPPQPHQPQPHQPQPHQPQPPQAHQPQPPRQHEPQPPAFNQQPNVAANPPADDDRMANIGGHLWLIIKLACFVYFFAGGDTGYYRPILLGVIASIVYLAQTGIFEAPFHIVRRHFEALLPIGALQDHVAPPIQAAHAPEENAANQSATANRNLTPQQAAQRLLQQHHDERFGWVRESARSVERAFALFVASLWPGIGERMVHAQEERERLERVARREAEERRVEEEKRRREEQDKSREEESRQEDVSGKTDDRVERELTEQEGEGSGSVKDKGKGKANDVGQYEGVGDAGIESSSGS